jgi:hypothetical protein
MIIELTTRIHTDVAISEDQFENLVLRANGRLGHALAQEDPTLSFEDRELTVTTYGGKYKSQSNEFEYYGDVTTKYRNRGQFEVTSSYLDILVDSIDQNELEPRKDANADAVSEQLCLFKSIRRPSTRTEMMAEVLAFCNRS